MKVKYNGCTYDQANFGGGSDPRMLLEIGKIYEVVNKEVHSWHTLYYIMVDGVGLSFNSVCFSEV